METASLSAALSPPPRTSAPAASSGADDGFAALLDQQAAPNTSDPAEKSAVREGKDPAPRAGTEDTAASATDAATNTAATGAAATGTTADDTTGDKGDRAERAIGDGADQEVADKLAGDAALTDPSAILTGMLLDLTAPAARKDAAAGTTTTEAPAPVPP
ncbi:hypothetical protein, partial [Zavarzinia sp.]|uniref:hypothetical protein n=1 Tax=Zavarzinia sp. TaxID=2027920 RepID=UPI003BB6CA6D